MIAESLPVNTATEGVNIKKNLTPIIVLTVFSQYCSCSIASCTNKGVLFLKQWQYVSLPLKIYGQR